MHSKTWIVLAWFLILGGTGNLLWGQTELKKGAVAPDFEISDPSGAIVNLNDLRGKMVLLDFWASWCLPCRMSNPDLVDLYNRYNEYGFEIFSVSLDTKKEAWEKAIKNDGLIWPYHGSDLKGWQSSAGELYNILAIPATFLIDEKGYIVETGLDKIGKRLKAIYDDQVFMYPRFVRDSVFFSARTRYVIKDNAGAELKKGRGNNASVSELPVGEYICQWGGKEELFYRVETARDSVTFYPVNVHDVITLSRGAQYELMNKKGMVKISDKGHEINMRNLPKGLYYLSIEGKVYKVFKN